MVKEDKRTKKYRFTQKIKSSIKARIQFFVILLVAVSLIIGGGVSIYSNYITTIATLEKTMLILAETATANVLWEIENYKTLAKETGLIAELSSSEVSLETKKQLLDTKVKSYNLEEAAIINTDGIIIFNGLDVSDRDYFKKAMAGEAYAAEPSISRLTGMLCMYVAAPLWGEGVYGTTIVGVVMYSIPAEFLIDIINSIVVSENSFSYMIDQNGYTIAAQSMDTVKNKENIEEIAKGDSSFSTLASFHQKMRRGEHGFGYHKKDGTKCLLVYAPVELGNGWSLAVNVSVSDFMSGTTISTAAIIIILLFTIVISVFLTRKIASGIGNPIKECAKRLMLLAEGDLKSKMPDIHTEDETRILVTATDEIVQYLNTIIKDMDYLLQNMAEGNFTVTTEAAESYVGDFKNLRYSTEELNNNLSNTIKQIKEAANQVAIGSSQLSESSQTLAEGATEQADSLQRLYTNVAGITKQVSMNAEELEGTYNKACEVEDEASISSRNMNEMEEAMKRINETSKQIESIIENIEDIASETNLLSLNAAIEAARAGEAGKGFAVVADEIRNLAEDSARAAANTRKLIETAVKEAQNGNYITGKTAASLVKVIMGVNQIKQNIKQASDVSKLQVESLSQVEQGTNQISEVTQSNSALAEESSAVSQEFTAQAVCLNDQVSRFKFLE